MTPDEVLTSLADVPGVLVWRPGPGDGSPELAWGDAFVYHSPDGTVPTTTQPFATVVTKDYPGDERSRLNRVGTVRVNVAVGRDAFHDLLGEAPHDLPGDIDASRPDAVMAHPVYGSQAWVCVVDPGPQTTDLLDLLLAAAHDAARARYERRQGDAS